jgi:hypothetical protein
MRISLLLHFRIATSLTELQCDQLVRKDEEEEEEEGMRVRVRVGVRVRVMVMARMRMRTWG